MPASDMRSSRRLNCGTPARNIGVCQCTHSSTLSGSTIATLASPLANVDKITVISTDGAAAGVNKVTGDITKIAAQVPALFETLSGMNLTELLGKVRQIGDKPAKPDNGQKK